MLPVLFMLIPEIEHLHVNIPRISYEPDFKKRFVNLSPLLHLKYFYLSSMDFWILDDMHTMLQQMPSLQTLILNVSTRDERFIHQEHFLKNLPSSLEQIHFLIRYHFSEATFDLKSLVTS